MTKARRELAALMPSQDVLVEVLDARMPGSSANPVIAALRGDRPCLRILTRADLEPLFRSAEGYLRMWEKAEARATALRRR